MTDALEVTVWAPVASFRDPLYAGVQVGLPCPSPATVGGLLAAAAGGWAKVDPGLTFGMAFHAAGKGVDLETYHPLDAAGRPTEPTPKDRPFHADITLTVWLIDELSFWERAMRRPVWPLRLGRSQDLATARTRRVTLYTGPARQGRALVPEPPSNADDARPTGTLLRLPTAVSLDRARTRWDAYRYHPNGSSAVIPTPHATETGQAVPMLPPAHPAQFALATR